MSRLTDDQNASHNQSVMSSNSHQKVQPLDGRQFFKIVKQRIPQEDFTKFLKVIKQLNAQTVSKEQAITTISEEIFG